MEEKTMKKKTLLNHLFFRKATIVNLDRLKMAAIFAGCGVDTIEETCDPVVCSGEYDGETKGSISTCWTEPITGV